MTRSQATIPGPFLREEKIAPGQIGAHKVESHQAFLRAWATRHGLDPDLVWLAQERCIAALSERDARARTQSR